MKHLISTHLKSLFRFAGREARGVFWPWVGIVMGVFMVVWMGFVTAFMASMSPGSPQPFAIVPVVMLILMTITVFLLASAVARRLHDTGRTALWGVAPLFFLFTFLVGMAVVWARIAAADESGNDDGIFPLFGLLFANNLLYLGTLGPLIVFCSAASQTGENRYGAGPEGEVAP